MHYTSYDGARVEVTGKALALARFIAVPHPLHRWKDRFAAVALTGETVVNGVDAFIVEAGPAGLAPTRLYVSAVTYLVLREEPPVYIGDTLLALAVSVDYSDYRVVNGIRIPFASALTVPLLGRVVLAYESVALDGPVDPKVFE